MIYRENNRRYIPIKFSVRGRDLASTMEDAQNRISHQLQLPEGFHYEWAGEYDSLKKEQRRLLIVIPISLAISPRASLRRIRRHARRPHRARHSSIRRHWRPAGPPDHGHALQRFGCRRICFSSRRGNPWRSASFSVRYVDYNAADIQSPKRFATEPCSRCVPS